MNPFELFEQRIEERQVNLHGYMVVKDNVVVSEKYFLDYDENSLHRMFSISKSFTSLAIGKMIEQGLIKLDDKICDYFPEYITEDTHPWIKEQTVRGMLKMATCHSKTTYNRELDSDWAKTFFTVKPDHRPGTLFAYDTSSSQVLAALVEKKTGMKLLDYLRDNILDEIGFSKEAYFITDPSGVSQGGTGLMCTLRDVTKVATLLCNGGKYNEKQLVDPDYLKEAVSRKISTNPLSPLDERLGYGFFFWMTRKEGFCMYGMGGQLALVFPELNLVFTCMADTQGSQGGLQHIFDAFYDFIYNAAEVKKWMPERLEPVKKPYKYGTVKGTETSLFNIQLQDKTAYFEGNDMDLSSVKFDFYDKKLYFKMGDDEFLIPYGYNTFKKFVFPRSREKAVSSAAWVSKNQFLIKIQVVGENLSPVIIEFGFRPDGAVSVNMRNTNEPLMLKKFSGYAGGTVEDK